MRMGAHIQRGTPELRAVSKVSQESTENERCLSIRAASYVSV